MLFGLVLFLVAAIGWNGGCSGNLHTTERGAPARSFSDRYTLQRLRMVLLERINQDRASHGLKPVEFDTLASVVADRHCKQEFEHHFHGHFGLESSHAMLSKCGTWTEAVS